MHSFGAEGSWKNPLERPRRRRDDNIKMDVKEDRV
jgi:hypothetical protein